MNIYPAIDIRDGKVVRLHKGDFAAETVYGDDPFGVAKLFVDAGATWIHVVDLDAARTGDPSNRPVIARMANELAVSVQTGGGVRNRAAVDELLGSGVARVVVGTMAVADRDLTEDLVEHAPGRVAIGLDARNGVVAAHGWVEDSQVTVSELVEHYSSFPVAAFVATDIDRDGTLQGPDVDGLRRTVASTTVPVIASGGIGSLDDLRSVRDAGVEGAITGKAIYEGRFVLADALAL